MSGILDEQVRNNGRTKKAIEKTVRYCVEHDILREYLSRKGETEIVGSVLLVGRGDRAQRTVPCLITGQRTVPCLPWITAVFPALPYPSSRGFWPR